MGAKAGVKLAYKSVFAPIFTLDVLNSYKLSIILVKITDFSKILLSV